MIHHTRFWLSVVFAALGLFTLSAPALGADLSLDSSPALDAPSVLAPTSPRLSIGTLRRLTPLSVTARWPAVTRTTGGEVIVAWEQDVYTSGTTSQDIFARVAVGSGTFNLPINVSNNTNRSKYPSLFNSGTGAFLLFSDGAPNYDFYIDTSFYNSGAWGPLQARYYSQNNVAIVPVGTQDKSGSNWVLWQQGFGGTMTDAVIKHLPGKLIDLSNDGSAAPAVAITSAPNGHIYVAWPDRANEEPGAQPGVMIRDWDGTRWSAIPAPTSSDNTMYPSLAKRKGLLYAAWTDINQGNAIVKRVWDGANWGAPINLWSSATAKYSTIVAAPSGNVYVAWSADGVVYLQRNGEAPVVASPGIANAQQPALYVDSSDVVYIAFQNGSIWYTTAQ